MKGVMTPGVSAGSNHVGASDTWTANVICPTGASERPSGAADTGGTSATVRASTTTDASDERRTVTVSSVLSSAGPCWHVRTAISRPQHTPPGVLGAPRLPRSDPDCVRDRAGVPDPGDPPGP